MKIIEGGIPTYNNEKIELKKILPKGYFIISGDDWFSIKEHVGWWILKTHIKTHVMIYCSTRHIRVDNKELFFIMKDFGEKFNYEKISMNYLDKTMQS